MPDSFFNKVNFIKIRISHMCFPANFAKFLRTPTFGLPEMFSKKVLLTKFVNPTGKHQFQRFFNRVGVSSLLNRDFG